MGVFTDCGKCGGRLFLDRATLNEEKIDFSCINCGHRKYLDPHAADGRYILSLERQRISAYGT